MSVETDIEAALFAKAKDIPLALPFAWPNRKFDPPSNGTYLRIRHFPNRPERLFFDGADKHRRQGFLQVSVVAPLDQGPTPATTFAGQVAEFFPGDLKMSSNAVKVRVTAAPTVGPAFETEQSWIVAVAIYYEAFA